MNRSKQHHGSRTGFTLIELLVVIAIIALLMSILMPALGQAREQANRIKCLSHLRGIGIGMLSYSSDYRETIVPASYLYGRGEEPGPQFRQDWAAILAINGYISAPIYPENEAPAHPEPVPEAAARSILQCPGASDIVRENWGEDPYVPVGPSDQPADLPDERRIIYFSYGSSGANNRGERQLPMRVHADYDNPPHTFPMAQRPGDTVLLYDGSWSHNGFVFERINAHHMNATQTAVLLMDGSTHAFDRDDLPKPDLNHMGNLSYLRDNYPYPLWRFDQ